MAETFSLWQMGRADNRFSSMVPHACPSGGNEIASVGLGMQALQTVATFGIWYELHQMNRLAAAQFEERRLVWLDQILEQWIAEHRDGSGISLDTTHHTGEEARRLFDSLLEHEEMDVPQILSLKCRRLTTYLDELSATWCAIISSLAASTQSDVAWQLSPRSSDGAARSFLQDNEDSSCSGNVWAALGGFAALFIPVVGPAIGGGLIGGSIGDLFDKRKAHDRRDRMARNIEVLGLVLATEQVLLTAEATRLFLEHQGIDSRFRVYARDAGAGRTQLLLGWDRRPSLVKRLFGAARVPKLRALPAPGDLPPRTTGET